MLASGWGICLFQLLYFLSLHTQYFMVDGYTAEDNKGMYESESLESLSSASLPHHQASQTLEKDLIVVKLQIYRYQLSQQNSSQH